MPRGKGPAGENRPKEEPSFEEALRRLEEIVAELEGGDQALERSLELFEEGTRLSRFLSAKLNEAQARIDRLVAGKGDGGSHLEPLEGEDRGEE